MENCVINAEERKKIWILASQAYVNSTMSHFNDYYQNLLNFNDFPDYFKHQIKVDVLRTTSFKPNVKIEAHRASLSNILNNYSKKNSIVGYCQGLNFIASFLLDLDMTE
jgi:predicted choloylglycine hydrolase